MNELIDLFNNLDLNNSNPNTKKISLVIDSKLKQLDKNNISINDINFLTEKLSNLELNITQEIISNKTISNLEIIDDFKKKLLTAITALNNKSRCHDVYSLDLISLPYQEAF